MPTSDEIKSRLAVRIISRAVAPLRSHSTASILEGFAAQKLHCDIKTTYKKYIPPLWSANTFRLVARC